MRPDFGGSLFPSTLPKRLDHHPELECAKTPAELKTVVHIIDDRILLSRHNGRLVARSHPALQGRIERRGLAIVALPYEAGTVLRLVVDLVVVSEDVDSPPRLPWLDVPLVDFGEIKLPHLLLDARRQRADQTDLIFAALETCPKWD